VAGPPSGQELLEEIDVNGDGVVTLAEFSELMESHAYILAPAFDLQRALRQRILGVRFWEGETRVRSALFADCDDDDHDSWEVTKKESAEYILLLHKLTRKDLCWRATVVTRQKPCGVALFFFFVSLGAL